MNLSRSIRIKVAAALLLAIAAPVGAQAPLSVIDWLGEDLAVARPTPAPEVNPTPKPGDEPPVANSAASPEIEMRPLDAPSLAAVGLLPPSRTGLPADMWRASDADTLTRLIDTLDTRGNPAMTALFFTLLVAEADAPALSGDGAAFLATRANRLKEMGAVEASEALLNMVGAEQPALFPVWLDVALLTGHEAHACAALRTNPALSTDLAARIFCAARGQDWQTAMTVLDSARALGTLPERLSEALLMFLEPEVAEDAGQIVPPVRPTPLEFRIYEAIGERVPTRTLRVPFAVLDLGGDAGWRAQIEAAERLARAGALSENQLLGIYTERLPAASGGVWDRTEAIQRLDQAMQARDPGGIARQLPSAWREMRQAQLEPTLAGLFGAPLLEFPLTGEAENIALRLALMSPDYELAAARAETRPDLRVAAALARGTAPDPLPDAPLPRAVAAAFAGPPEIPATLQPVIAENRLGEAVLRAIEAVMAGHEGNPRSLTDGLMALRAMGLEDAARRAALQLVLSGAASR